MNPNISRPEAPADRLACIPGRGEGAPPPPPLSLGPSINSSRPIGSEGQALVRLGFVGDVMLGRGVSAAAATKAPDQFWGDVRPLLMGANAVLANLECPITDSPQRWKRCWKAFRFRADPRTVAILNAGNIQFVNIANNHILDCETKGLADTLHHLDAAGIAHAGAGLGSREALKPALFEAGGVKIGVIAVTNTMREYVAGPASPGTNFLRIRTDHLTLGTLSYLLDGLREAGARIAVLSAHWGPNLRPWPPARFCRFARAVIDLGFDVFHGHSAHLLQGFEFRGRGLILYDTGDFLDDYWVFPGVRTDRSGLFLVDFDSRGVQRLRIVPVSLTPAQARLARGREARTIAAGMLKRSRPFIDRNSTSLAAMEFTANQPPMRARVGTAAASTETDPERPSIAVGGMK